LPFSVNPGNKSYCGIGLGNGSRDQFIQTNSFLIYINNTKFDYECVMKARALQKTLLQQCSKDTPIKDKCFRKTNNSNPKKFKGNSINKISQKLAPLMIPKDEIKRISKTIL